jgi:5-formyltetrahydrofolate cyclo-ligase
MTHAQDEAKATLRSTMRARLATLDTAHRAAANAAVTPLLASVLRGVSQGVLMGFLSLPDEIDVTCTLQRWLDEGGQCAAPVMNWAKGSMRAGRLEGLEPPHVRMGMRGIREPNGDEVIELDTLAAVLVPGLAFDAGGQRIGRGGGFYDRFLSEVPPDVLRVGVCLDEQVVEAVAVCEHDQRVDLIVTPAGIVQVG